MTTNPPGNLRVSDAERDSAVSELSEHFQAGRLTMEEFQERSDQAFHAKTRADLARLLADLPRTPRPAPRVPEPSRSGPHRPVAPLVMALSGMLAFTVFWVILSVSQHRVVFVAPLIIWLVVFARMIRGRGRDHR